MSKSVNNEKANVISIYDRTPERNGVKAPTRGVTRMMWELLDTATEEVTSKHIHDIAEKTGWNERLLRNHMYHWRRYHRKAGTTTKKAAKAGTGGGTRVKTTATAKGAAQRVPVKQRAHKAARSVAGTSRAAA